MSDLVAFLRARLDEDEAAAKAATPGPWEVNDPTYAEFIRAPDGTTPVAGGRWGGEASVFESTEDALHIARHDPARVLREVEAKRRMVNVLEGERRAGLQRGSGQVGLERWQLADELLSLLALPYADHPDYDPVWAPGT